MPIPKRVADRITGCLKTYQTVLAQQRDRDVSEADTVTIIKDLLCDLFGYDKYAELTSEHSIRGTYCDLAVKLDAKLAFLIEVKAIGVGLKDNHVKQAIDYAANQGVEWVVLTNGVEWRLFRVIFQKPIDKQEVATFNLLNMSTRNKSDLETLYLLTREGFSKSALAEYTDRKEATSRYMLAAIILGSDSVKSTLRREIRRVSELLVEPEEIERMLRDEVLKRDAIEGPEADAANRRVARCADRSIKQAPKAGKPAPVMGNHPPDGPAEPTHTDGS